MCHTCSILDTKRVGRTRLFFRRLCSSFGIVADDFVVGIGRDAIDQRVQKREQHKADGGGQRQKQRVGQVEQRQQFGDERKGEREMRACQQQRNEEHSQQLGIDALFDVVLGHADLLHDVEPLLILATECGIWDVTFAVVERRP